MTQYNQVSYSGDSREKLTAWSTSEWVRAKGVVDTIQDLRVSLARTDQEGCDASLPEIHKGVPSFPVMLLASLSPSLLSLYLHRFLPSFTLSLLPSLPLFLSLSSSLFLVVSDMNLGSILHGIFLI